jgi:hypothetical protein
VREREREKERERERERKRERQRERERVIERVHILSAGIALAYLRTLLEVVVGAHLAFLVRLSSADMACTA